MELHKPAYEMIIMLHILLGWPNPSKLVWTDYAIAPQLWDNIERDGQSSLSSMYKIHEQGPRDLKGLE